MDMTGRPSNLVTLSSAPKSQQEAFLLQFTKYIHPYFNGAENGVISAQITTKNPLAKTCMRFGDEVHKG